MFAALFFVLPPICATIAFAVFCAVGVWELLHTAGKLDRHPYLYISCVAALCVPFAAGSTTGSLWPVMALVYVFMMATFACGVFDHRRIGYAEMGRGFLAAIVLPLMLSSVLRIFAMPDGKFIMFIPWFTVWMCDSAALFIGKAFGKHKLAPYVSPKKTVEGFVGGLLGGIIGAAGYTFVVTRYFGVDIAILPVAAFGLVGACVGQLGDLALSVIKREAGIKDYGKLFPGHGGVWDRFDSITFAAPLFELALLAMGMMK